MAGCCEGTLRTITNAVPGDGVRLTVGVVPEFMKFDVIGVLSVGCIPVVLGSFKVTKPGCCVFIEPKVPASPPKETTEVPWPTPIGQVGTFIVTRPDDCVDAEIGLALGVTELVKVTSPCVAMGMTLTLLA